MKTNLVYFQIMEFGRSPATPSQRRSNAVTAVGPLTPKTPHTRQRNRSGSINSPSGMSRVNTSSTATPTRERERSCLMSPGTTSTPSTTTTHLHDQQASDSPDQRAKSVFSRTPISQSFSLVEQIGEGTFSTVYLAQDKHLPLRKLALKHLVPTSKPSRILMEAECMKAAGGHHNVIQLLGMWRVGGDVILAMPHIDHCKFIDLVATTTLEEVKLYIANLLSALAHIHQLGIIHRDIKPSNFLYDRRGRKFALVDFGLAQYERDILGSSRPVKRKIEDESESANKKARPPLAEADSQLNRKSPRARILRDYRSSGVRRSPRKFCVGPDTGGSSGVGMSPVLLDSLEAAGPLEVSLTSSMPEIPKKSNFTTPRKTPSETPPVRCSPRKNLAQMRKNLPVVKMGMKSIISPDLSTPSPSFSRSPSFTMLDVSCQSQLTEISGVTGLFRASVTSRCSSALQGRPELPATPRPGLKVSCSCPGQMTVCSSCLTLPHLHAPRAGTPGFRPPEVLLKSPHQSVAVDIWAVGVILLSLLSRSYPFFRSPDDMTALAELISLFGSREVQAAAKK